MAGTGSSSYCSPPPAGNGQGALAQGMSSLTCCSGVATCSGDDTGMPGSAAM